MAERTLPPFPVDDVALDAVEHALGASLDVSGGDPDNPAVVGAEYTLSRLLDFYAGFQTDDRPPVGYTEVAGHGEVARYDYSDQGTYTEHDLIAALIAEVRRLRGGV